MCRWSLKGLCLRMVLTDDISGTCKSTFILVSLIEQDLYMTCIQWSLYFTTLYFKTTPDYKTAWFGPKGQFSVLNDLNFKTTCNIRPQFLGHLGGLKREGPLYEPGNYRYVLRVKLNNLVWIKVSLHSLATGDLCLPIPNDMLIYPPSPMRGSTFQLWATVSIANPTPSLSISAV